MSDFNLMNNNIKPREKLMKTGPDNLSDAELLAIIIQVGSKKSSVMQTAQELLEKAGGIENLFNLKLEKLLQFDSIGEVKAIKLIVISELIKRIEKEKKLKTVVKVSKPQDVHELLKYIGSEKQENFYVVLLDTKNNVICFKLIFKGTLNSIVIHPREVFKEAIENSADKIIIVHNHPSQNPIASTEDVEITQRFYALSQILGIALVDHIIITENSYYSIFENHKIY